uniref:Uncharacterized protein n=1 Tax=Strigamia maritima TaxID=126957 RepID=T1J1Z9_STRMM
MDDNMELVMVTYNFDIFFLFRCYEPMTLLIAGRTIERNFTSFSRV